MKPQPFSSLNHLTLPTAIGMPPLQLMQLPLTPASAWVFAKGFFARPSADTTGRQSLSSRLLFEGVELFEVRFYARIRGVDFLRSHQRRTRFAACFLVLRERRCEVDPRARELVVDAK